MAMNTCQPWRLLQLSLQTCWWRKLALIVSTLRILRSRHWGSHMCHRQHDFILGYPWLNKPRIS